MRIGGTPTYTGTSLDQSTAVDLDIAILLVSEVGPSDDSGLTPGADTIDLSPRDIVFGTGPGTPPGFSVTKSWTGDNNDMFTETLTTVDSIDRSTLDQVIVHLSGTVSDSLAPLRGYAGLFRFERHPIWRSGDCHAGDIHQYGDCTGVIPEPSTWIMMALGFGALGYAASRRPNANIAAPFPVSSKA